MTSPPSHRSAALLLLLLAASAGVRADGPLRTDPVNPHYFNYRGRPLVLVTTDNTWFTVTAADYDYVKFVDALAANHNNFTRLYPGAHPVNYENQPRIFPWKQVADGRYDLDQWNPAFFARLHAFMAYAQKKDIIVDVCLFNGWGLDEKGNYQWRWDWCPLNDANNVQEGVGLKRDTHCTLEEPKLVAYQQAYVRKLVTELNRYDNLIYDVADEPDFFNAIDDRKVNPWIDVMLDEIIATEAKLPKRHLVAQTYHPSLENNGRKWGADPRTTWISVEYTNGLDSFPRQYVHGKPYVLIETTTPILNPLGFWGQEYGVDSSRVHGWPFLTAGGAGVLEFNDDYDSQAPAGRERTAAILKQRGILRRFIESFDFVRMRPFKDFSGINPTPLRQRANVTGVDAATVRIEDLNRAWGTAMAEPGRQYALYVSHSYIGSAHARIGAAGGGPGCYRVVPGTYRETITLQGVPAGSYRVEWINPADGAVVHETAVRHPGGDLPLETPTYTVDLALRIKRQEAFAAPARPAPTRADVAYGPHERQVLDFWAPRTPGPAPLAIYIHGGGFSGGSKERLAVAELQTLLEAGIAVAALHYRFIQHAPLPAAHHDVARAVQFLRSRAAEWRIDPARVAAFGGSAGAQLAMYLAFHDDLARPDSPDPIVRESTRLRCVAAQGGQAAMDLAWLDAHIPGYVTRTSRPPTVQAWNDKWYGVDGEAARRVIADISALALLSRDDPPLFMTYGMAPDASPPAEREKLEGWISHHVAHGVAIQRRGQEVGMEVHLKYPGAKTRYSSGIDFLKVKLLAQP